MANLKAPGLYKRGEFWHMDKVVFGRRICESTYARTLIEAEKYVAHRIEQLRKAVIYGQRKARSFRKAGKKFLKENKHLKSINDIKKQLKILNEFIGNFMLHTVNMGSLQTFIQARREQGVKNRTINYALQVIRRILNLAATEWLDEHCVTWLANAPKIKLLPQHDARKPYPLSWKEQDGGGIVSNDG